MRKICLVFLVDESSDCLTAFERAFKEIGFEVETFKIPYLWIFSRSYVSRLKALFKKQSQGHFLIFSPQSTELFLKGADITITYSAYRSWYSHEKVRVIPHIWTPARSPESIDHLRWTSKPPLRIGFMGRSFTNSRLSNIALKLPLQLKQWILGGTYLQYPRLIALMNDLGLSTKAIGTFPRIETMKILKEGREKYSDIELDIAEKQSFTGSEDELNEYINHLERNTYIVCPRGTENYSYRIYETLSRGRIPVIIDTDVVLPAEIDWDYLSVRVPYESLDRIFDIVLRDYNSWSGSEFVARQNEAFSSMASLQTMRWVKDLATELGGIAENDLV